MLHSRQTIVTLVVLVLAAALTACGRPGEPVEPPGEGDRSEPASEEATLGGTEWVLTSLNGNSPVEDSTITLAFHNEDEISGNGGCNNYFAAYTRDGSFLTCETPAATEMACSGPAGVMEQEQRYLGLLGDVTVYRTYGSQLWLETDDGRALVFTAQE